MTIKDCIDIVDKQKPNQYTIKEKVMWLSFIDEIIINEVLKTHEGYDGRYDAFEGYTEDKLSVSLIVPSPYDRLYTAFLKMKIDGENGEAARYNSSSALYNTYMTEYRKHYHKTHMPLSVTNRRPIVPPKKVNIGLSDAEYENLKKDMTYILTEYFSDKGVDYFFDEERNKLKEEMRGFISELCGNEITALQKSIAELKKSINDLGSRSRSKTVMISLNASKWVRIENGYYQTVFIEGITEHSKVDLQPSAEQMAIFYEKDIAFVTENENGVITVYCIGQKPTLNYEIQATITEVLPNG